MPVESQKLSRLVGTAFSILCRKDIKSSVKPCDSKLKVRSSLLFLISISQSLVLHPPYVLPHGSRISDLFPLRSVESILQSTPYYLQALPFQFRLVILLHP